MAINEDKLNQLLGKFVADFGATFHAGLVVIGETLGLYKALAGQSLTPAELAERTSTDARYVREWLNSQAAGEYVQLLRRMGFSQPNANKGMRATTSHLSPTMVECGRG